MDSFDCEIQGKLKPLIDGLLAGEIPRRDFLRRAVGLGLKSSAAYALLNQSMANAQVRYTTKAMINGRPEEEAAAPRPKPGTPTTLRAEVPGQRPEEEQASTRAMGEEGRPNPTTMRANAPGMRPEEEQASTRATGEENATTLRVGEENATTRRLGEENATTTAIINGRPEEDQVSTKAIGEEDRTTYHVGEEDQASTRAKGEENVTTQRIGEESVTTMALVNGRPEEDQVSTRAYGEEGTGQVTTYAVGEEGPGQVEVPRQSVTTFALGEEGTTVPPSNQPQLGPGEYIVDPGPQLGPGEYIVPTPTQSPQPIWDGFRRWPIK